MLGSFLLKLCMSFSGFFNSWVGLTLHEPASNREQKTRNSALVAARFPSGISLKMTICLGRVQSWVPWDETSWVAVVSESWPPKFFGQIWRSSEAYLLNLLGFGQLSLGWVESDAGRSRWYQTIFLKRRCASRFSWIFGGNMNQKISDFSLYGLLYKNESCSLQFQVVWKLRLDPGNPHQSASQVVLGIVHNPLWTMDGWNIRGESHHLCFFQCLIHGCNLKFANKKKQHGSPNWQHLFMLVMLVETSFPMGLLK